MKKELYADTIGQIHCTGNMVRFDFAPLQPAEEGNGTMEVTTRMIMPMDGFLNFFNSMNQMVNKLVEAGVLKKNEPAEAPAEEKAE